MAWRSTTPLHLQFFAAQVEHYRNREFVPKLGERQPRQPSCPPEVVLGLILRPALVAVNEVAANDLPKLARLAVPQVIQLGIPIGVRQNPC